MKEQKIITGTNLLSFESLVNIHLNEGWYVVPGTLIASVSTATSGIYNHTTERAFVVVVEKNSTI